MKNTSSQTLLMALCLFLCALPLWGEVPAAFTADSLPSSWGADARGLSTVAERRWWVLFHDPALNELVERASEGNRQLAGALRRMEASQMAVKATRAAYYPQVQASAGWNVMRNSGRTTAKFAETERVDYFSAGLSMSWEIDVFGRIGAQVKEGKAQVELSRADYEGAMLSVRAGMAKAYFGYLAAVAERRVAENQLESQRKILAITELRKETGLSSGLDVAQALTTVLTTEASLPSIRANERSSLNAMALLAGTFTPEIERIIAVSDSALLPPLPEVVPVGIPSDMISMRPDILTARAQIDACASRLGLARKDWLPAVSLEAAAGTQSSRFDELFSKGSYYWEVAPKVSWTVFDGLARNSNIAGAKLTLEAVVENYNEAVLTAWSEVENAVESYRAACERMELERKVLDQAEKTFALSLDLYKQGLVGFTNVQDAQVSCLASRNNIIAAHYAALDALVTLFQSLGLSGETDN